MRSAKVLHILHLSLCGVISASAVRTVEERRRTLQGCKALGMCPIRLHQHQVEVVFCEDDRVLMRAIRKAAPKLKPGVSALSRQKHVRRTRSLTRAKSLLSTCGTWTRSSTVCMRVAAFWSYPPTRTIWQSRQLGYVREESLATYSALPTESEAPVQPGKRGVIALLVHRLFKRAVPEPRPHVVFWRRIHPWATNDGQHPQRLLSGSRSPLEVHVDLRARYEPPAVQLVPQLAHGCAVQQRRPLRIAAPTTFDVELIGDEGVGRWQAQTLAL